MDSLENWVRAQLKRGFPPEAIKQQLIKYGHDPKIVDNVLSESSIAESQQKSIGHKSPMKFVLVIFLVILLLSSTSFAVYHYAFKDKEPPTGSISISAQKQIDALSYVNTKEVTLDLQCSDSKGCYEMQFSNDGDAYSDP